MKKITFLLVTLLTICSCTCNQETKNNSHERVLNAKEAKNEFYTKDISYSTYVFEKECNGHIYVVARTSGTQSGIQMLHSPNCKCFKELDNN